MSDTPRKSRFGWFAVSAVASFLLTLVLTNAFSTELSQRGVRLNEFIRRDVFYALFGPPGVEVLPVTQTQYSAELAGPNYRLSSLIALWRMYRQDPDRFRLTARVHDEDVHCWPNGPRDPHTGIAFMTLRFHRTLIMDAPTDAIICTTIDDMHSHIAPGSDDVSIDCPRMGCPSSIYVQFGGQWQLVFDDPYCTRLLPLDTEQLGMRDILCKGFGDGILRWDGSHYIRTKNTIEPT